MKLREELKFVFSEFGTSGREFPVMNKIESHVKGKVDGIEHDTSGSLILFKKGNGKNKKKMMIAAHADTIGIILTHIDDKGFLRFSHVGGMSNLSFLLGKRVRFENGIYGVIHIEDRSQTVPVTMQKLYIDIGADSKAQSEEMISLGMMGFLESSIIEQNGKLISSFLDDRIGCYILLDLIDTLKTAYHDIYFVFTTQEEVGVRGAITSSYRITPDVGFAVDITVASDMPEAPLWSSCSMGKGAAIKVMDGGLIVNQKLIDFVCRLADKKKIKYQKEILAGGSTDAMAMNTSKSGILASAISVPTRYFHTANEMCDTNDIVECAHLLEALIQTEFVL